MIEQFKTIFTEPSKFYKGVKNWSYGDVLKFLFAVALLPSVLNWYAELSAEITQGELGEMLNFPEPTLILIAILLATLSIFISPFINSAITHLGVLIVGGRGYKKTFLATGNALAISAAYILVYSILGLFMLEQEHTLIATLIIIVMLAGFIHALVTEIIGLKVLHNLSTGKAVIAAIIVPLAVVFLIGLILITILVLLTISLGIGGHL